jgi:hypothetical protein
MTRKEWLKKLKPGDLVLHIWHPLYAKIYHINTPSLVIPVREKTELFIYTLAGRFSTVSGEADMYFHPVRGEKKAALSQIFPFPDERKSKVKRLKRR